MSCIGLSGSPQNVMQLLQEVFWWSAWHKTPDCRQFRQIFLRLLKRYFGKCKKSPFVVKVDKTKHLIMSKINFGWLRLMTSKNIREVENILWWWKKNIHKQLSAQFSWNLFISYSAFMSFPGHLTRNPQMQSALKVLQKRNYEKWGLWK